MFDVHTALLFSFYLLKTLCFAFKLNKVYYTQVLILSLSLML